MSSIDGQVWRVLTPLVCASVLGLSTPAWAATYFCDFSKGIELGTYRPDDSDEELVISVSSSEADKKFWFDEASGDYQPHGEGQPFPVEHSKLPVPLEQAVMDLMTGNYSTEDTGRLGLAYFIQVGRSLCVEAPMGELPAPTAEVSKP